MLLPSSLIPHHLISTSQLRKVSLARACSHQNESRERGVGNNWDNKEHSLLQSHQNSGWGFRKKRGHESKCSICPCCSSDQFIALDNYIVHYCPYVHACFFPCNDTVGLKKIVPTLNCSEEKLWISIKRHCCCIFFLF